MPQPLVVDLDGTLLRSDMLLETVLGSVNGNLSLLFRMPFWMLKGKAYMKERLAKQAVVKEELLPYNRGLVSFLEAERRHRPVVLATATHKIYAERIAAYLGVFDRVIATEHGHNLSAHAKRERLVAEYGEKGFDYIGNSLADIPVFASAEKAYLADPEPGVLKKTQLLGNLVQVFVSRSGSMQTVVRALRPHQWLKNLLIFIPLLAAHQIGSFDAIGSSLLAFILFSLVASSGYIVNDLLDLDSDRHHTRKRLRPFASGDMPLAWGVLAVPILLMLSLAVSFWLMAPGFSVALLVYALFTFSYSQYLKKIAVVDTIVLAGLYTVRIIAGAYACGLIPTFWILAFSMFLFLSLAMVKRYAEVLDLQRDDDLERTRGRGYYAGDLEIIANLGTAAGYLSVLVLALYIQDERTMSMYSNPELIWLACPILLFWISRVWLVTHRGQMHDDPVLYAVKDRVSLGVGTVFAMVFVLAALL